MATEFGVDVFMFAESAFQPEELIAALQVAKIGRYCFPKAENKRIQIYTRFKQSALDEKYNSVDDRLTIRSLGTETTTVLLAVIHFQSQWYATPNDQAMQTQVVSRNIVQTENELGHQRTILVGDLNMNPFDPGMVHAQGLNSVMTRNLADAKIVSSRVSHTGCSIIQCGAILVTGRPDHREHIIIRMITNGTFSIKCCSGPN